MSRFIAIASGIFCLVLCSSAAHALVTPHWVAVNDAIPGTGTPDYPAAALSDPLGPGALLSTGYETWDLKVTLGVGDKWTVAALDIPVANLGVGGTFYNTSLGGNVRPLPATVSASPATAYDTFVDTFSGGVNIPGRAVGAGSEDVGAPNFNVSWGTNNLIADPAGAIDYSIVRLTFKRADPTLAVLRLL